MRKSSIGVAGRLLKSGTSSFCYQQRRHAQVHDIRFLASHATPEKQVLEKYAEKLKQKAKEEGHQDIDSLKQAYSDKITSLRKEATVPGANAPSASPSSDAKTPNTPFQPPPPPTPQSSPSVAAQYTSTSKAGIKTLSSYIDVDKFRSLPDKELETLWRLRHATNPRSLCGIVRADVFRQIATAAKKHPQFILPIPREGQGAELHFLQWTFPSDTTATVLFTNLAEFKLRGEFAQPHTTVTHHLDLVGEKGVVLVEGNVLPDRGMTVEEGQLLVMMLTKFYGQGEESPRRHLLGQFTKGDETFSVDQLLEEAEKVP
ncbi:ATP11 protein-domain-containing protein [Elsinoe ampelina]|uniref:ATP11 protein-domain-containing protein n=1 Tax=Elsinoe ampelina TaxID=302913 RepID=A0A6A6G5Q2_9PEZI|nr:ATP11 protein-domain-containing protein [Elsinoe ampelina]